MGQRPSVHTVFISLGTLYLPPEPVEHKLSVQGNVAGSFLTTL